jgi:hypothetical protein
MVFIDSQHKKISFMFEIKSFLLIVIQVIEILAILAHSEIWEQK